MEGGGEQMKHICKVCKRNFPCGRSLGGHMRSHMSVNSLSEPEERLPPASRNLVGLGGGGPSYGLRENPKKNWRLSDFVGDDSSKRGKLCRECGKGFPSWKALFGHMRCHRDRSSPHTLDQEVEQVAAVEEEEECSWSGESGKPAVVAGEPDEEVAAVMVPRRKRRSRRAAAVASSSSVSEIEQELEDVAMCLMMLSKDVGIWGGIPPITESSDKNSAVLEEEKEIAENEEGGFVADRTEILKAKNPETEKKGSEPGILKHGYLREGLKKLESDFSGDGFGIISREYKFQMPEVYVASHAEFQELRNKSSKKIRQTLAIGELGKRSRGESEFDKYNSSKKGRFDAYASKSSGDDDNQAYDASYVCDLGKNPDKKSRFQCTTCNKIFLSYQALGGHRASHKRIKGCSQGNFDGGENSTETEISVDAVAVEDTTDRKTAVEVSLSSPFKKVRRHECSICLKVFPSGQALGGHKRSHVAANNSDNGGDASYDQTMVTQLQQQPDLLDLNLPAPASEDSDNSDGNVGLKTWWMGSNHKVEPLVGVVSN